MKNNPTSLSRRWVYLAVGIFAMLFAGILYAWSILNVPFAEEFHWTPSELALNFTLTMCFFCIGGLLGAKLSKALGVRLTVLLAAVLAAGGFLLTATLDGNSVFLLYVTYGLLAGLGIGIAYNVIVATVGAWFPDKKGLCSGCLMMGFGASALVLGELASSLMEGSLGWRKTFVILGIALGVVLVAAALILKRPGADVELPAPPQKKTGESWNQDFTTPQMLKRPSFWLCFFHLVFLAAVGSSVISFARNLTISVGAEESLATSLVGVLSICNGLGRILTGTLYDTLGRKKTMVLMNLVTICAAGATLVAILLNSVPLCVVGLCLTGASYGSCATTSATFPSVFYGMKHYPSNVATMTFNLMGGSFVATLSSRLMESSGGYVAPFILLLCLSVAALGLNLSIRKP